MKRKVHLAIPWLMALILFLNFNSWGQGTETFDNSTATATYADGSFVGNNGITWSYVHSRNEGDYPINGKGIMLRRADEPSSLSATIAGGIGNFSVDTRKAFTGDSPRKLELVINGNVIAQFEPVYGSGADATVIPFIVNDINISGDVNLVLRLYGAVGNQQIVLDNMSWTAAGEATQVATPTISPAGGNFYGPVEVSISTLTEGATIYYTLDGTDPVATSTLYTVPFTVSEATTVKAIGIKEGLDNSNIASATFSFPAVTDVATIAELKSGLTDGTAYRLTGEALITAMDGFNNRKFIQDASGAIMIYDSQGIIETNYSIGNKIHNVAGTLTLVNNMLRFVPVADPGAAVSTGNPVTPTVFTIDALATVDQAKLVTLKNVTFTSTGTFANGQNYEITDGTNTFVLRTDFWNVDYIGTAIPTTTYNITGVIVQYNTTLQIVPRSLADFYEVHYNTIFQFSAVDANLPTWFGSQLARGFAVYNNILYVANRNATAGQQVQVHNRLTGEITGALNTTGVEGGTFALNDVEVSADGVVLLGNLAQSTGGTFTIYKLDETDPAEVLISLSLADVGASRLGDKFTVVGSFADGSAKIFAADAAAGSPRVFIWSMTADPVKQGFSFGAPEVIATNAIGTTNGSNASVAPLPNGQFYITGGGINVYKLNADGSLIGMVSGGIVATGSSALKYLGTDGDDEILAVFLYGAGNEKARILRIPNGDPTAAVIEFDTPTLGTTNSTGNADVTFVPASDNKNADLYVLSATNGLAYYVTLNFDLEFPYYGAPAIVYEVTFNVNMTYAEGFDPATDVVYLAGVLNWTPPGEDTGNQTMTRVGETMVWTKTLQLEAGTYAYKYFLNAGWDGGEWAGGANRDLIVEADMVVNDWFGYMTQPTARMQIIHNSADAAVEEVDIYINGELFLEDFAFRTATPFVDVPAGVELNIVVAPAGAVIGDGVGPITVTLTEGGTYIAIANGIVSAGYDPAQPFSLDIFSTAREAAAVATEIDILAFHGSTDAPEVSVWVMGGTAELFNFAYGEFAGYLSIAPADLVLEVRSLDGTTVVAAYQASLASLGLVGEAITVVASGFLTPEEGQAAFGLYVATADGGALLALPVYVPPTFTVTFDVKNEAGNPITDAVVTLNGVSNAAGNYVFTDIVPGTYAYTVAKAGYFNKTGDAVVADQDLTVNVEMQVDDTSIADPGMENIRVFPVPARTTIFITSPELIRDLRIIDMVGQVVYTANVAGLEHEVNVGEFKNGIYFVQILTARGIETRKIQVQN